MKLGTESKSKKRFKIRTSATGGFLTLSGLQSAAQDYNAEAIDVVRCFEYVVWRR